MTRDLIPPFRKGEIIRASALEQLRIVATQQHGDSGSFVDGTGVFTRRQTRRERGIWFKPDTDVPANGVMYVTGVDDTQGDQLVLTTKKPDGLAFGEILMVNGPEAAPADRYAKGWMIADVPIKALVNSSETVATGDVCGPKSGQWDLYKDFPGLIAFDAKDGNDLTWVRLDPDPTMDVELKDNLPSSGSVSAGQHATAYRLQPDGDVDTGTEVEVYDERGEFRGKAHASGVDRGSKGVVGWHREEDRVSIRRLQPHTLRISGTTSAVVYYDDTEFTAASTPVIMNPTGAIALHDYTTADLIKNPFGLQFASGDKFHAEWNEKATTPQWEAVDVGRPRPHRITGVASGAVTTSTETFTLTGSPKIINPVDAISEEVFTAANLIKNPYALEFANGATVFIEWNKTDSQWEAIGPVAGSGGSTTHQARWLEFTASVAFEAGGNITIDTRTYHDGTTPATPVTTIYNPEGFTGSDNDTGIAIYDADNDRYYAITPGPSGYQARWLIGVATNDFLAAPSTITINSSPTYKDGFAPTSDPSTVANDLDLTGNSSAKVIALHDGDGTYSAVNVIHVTEELLTDFNVDTTNFELEKKVRSISVMPRGDESASWVEVHQGDDCT